MHAKTGRFPANGPAMLRGRCGYAVIITAVLLALWPVADTARGEAVAYFEKAGPGPALNPAYGLRVESVATNWPAHLAGIKPGDIIVGFDGLRVRDSREFLMVRFNSCSPSTAVSVVRDGKHLEFVVPELMMGRRLGATMKEPDHDFAKLLASAGISLDDVLCAPAPVIYRSAQVKPEDKTAVDDITAAFDYKPPAPVTPDRFALQNLPCRAQEAIAAALKANKPGAKNRAIGLLKATDLLRHEKYGDAKKLIAEQKLIEQETDPFLAQLLRFYGALCARPITAQNGFSLGAYGVDPDFLALCFPYPVIETECWLSFAPDDEFETLFLQVMAGRAGTEREITKHAAFYSWTSADVKGEREHIHLLRQSLICPSSCYGELPSRGVTGYDRLTTLERLKKLPETRPDLKLDTSLCMACHAIANKDPELFRQSYETISHSGALVWAAANRLINESIVARNVPGAPFRAIREEIEAKSLARPFVYEHLKTISPAFQERMRSGIFLRISDRLTDPSSYCSEYPLIIAKALRRPFDSQRVDAAIPDLPGKTAPEDRRAAFHALAYDVAMDPKPQRLDMILKQEGTLGVGTILEFIGQVAACKCGMHSVMPLHTAYAPFLKACEKFFDSIEQTRYEAAAASAKAWAKADPAIAAKAAELYRTAGTPAVCVLIAATLKDLGYAEEAARYLRKAEGFLDLYSHAFDEPDVIRYFVDDTYESRDYLRWGFPRDAHYRACRDFAAMPGFEPELQRCMNDYPPCRHDRRPAKGGLPGRCMCLFEAMLAIRGDDPAKAVAAMVNVAGHSTLGVPRIPHLAEGKFFKTRRDQEMYFMEKLLADKRLTDQQREQLKSTAMFTDSLKKSGGTAARIAELEKKAAGDSAESSLAQLANLEIGQKQYAKAAEALKKLVAVNPKPNYFDWLIETLGKAGDHRGQIEASLEYYKAHPDAANEQVRRHTPEEIKEYGPRFASVLPRWGNSLRCEDLIEAYRADKQLDKAMELAKDKLRAHDLLALRMRLGRLLRDAGKYDEAIALFQETKDKKKDDMRGSQGLDIIKEITLTYEAAGRNSTALGYLLSLKDELRITTRDMKQWYEKKVAELEKLPDKN